MMKLAILCFLLFSQLYAMEDESRLDQFSSSGKLSSGELHQSTFPDESDCKETSVVEKFRKRVTFAEGIVEREPSLDFKLRKSGFLSREKEMRSFLSSIPIRSDEKVRKGIAGRFNAIVTESSMKVKARAGDERAAEEDLKAIAFSDPEISITSNAGIAAREDEEEGWSD
ncbi:MAG: hypothetical protein EBT45_00870 [Alphaproteobacteria bacterium]|jgi:hypothetical protein|nr:hypothetical protein [Alphaproteobacteria bacterium]